MNESKQDLLAAAVLYTAARNANTIPATRRTLIQRFQIDAAEVEIEAVCAKLAGEAVLKLAALARKQ